MGGKGKKGGGGGGGEYQKTLTTVAEAPLTQTPNTKIRTHMHRKQHTHAKILLMIDLLYRRGRGGSKRREMGPKRGYTLSPQIRVCLSETKKGVELNTKARGGKMEAVVPH